MKFGVLLIFTLIISTVTAYSQILSIEKFRLNKDTANAWFASVGIGYSAKKQQISVTTLNGNSNLVYLSKKHSFMNLNYIKYFRVANSESISEGYTHWRLNLMRKNTISYEPFLQFQYDRGRGLLFRNLYGFTFRLDIQSREKMTIGFNTGAMFEHERWKGNVLRFQSETPGIGETFFLKSTSNISIRWMIAEHVNLYLLTYYQARFTNFFRPRVISDIQLVYDFTSNFGITAQYILTYDAAPILTQNEFIQTYNLSLNYKF